MKNGFPKNDYDDDYSTESIDNISIDNYFTVELTTEVDRKIKRLKKIADSIEKKTSKKSTIKLSKKYRIDYRRELNPGQLSAVTTIDGPVLVIAGAGSGKTRTIIYRLAYFIENNIPPSHILLLTFTRKAAGEMLTRASILLNKQCQQIMGGTFHAFANYILRKHSRIIKILPNFSVIDAADSADAIDLVRHSLKFEKKSRAFPRKSRLQTIISKAKNCNVKISKIVDKYFSELDEFVEDIEIIAREYTKYKKANNILDFDDLMDMLRDNLKSNALFREKIQEAFPYIMCDEFQDTNVVQKEIVDLIAGKYKNLMVVGDDAQSIYSFRGANFENILLFPETYPDCKVIKIEQNYRSSQELLDFTNSVIDHAVIGYKKKLFSEDTSKVKPLFGQFYDQESEAEFIVDKVLELREKDIPLHEIAVLYRATYHGNYIQAELLKRNIPYVVYGGIRFVERRHVKDIISYLRIILNPLDAVAWNRILKLVPGIGSVTARKIIDRIMSNKGKMYFNDYSSKKFFPELQKLAKALSLSSSNNTSIPEKIEILKKYYTPILRNLESDYDIRILDINLLNELATKYNDLAQFLTDFALDPPSNRFQQQNRPLIDESEEKPLVLSTVHSAKGLEWHTVFIPHLLDGLLPSEKCMENIEELEEERRLFYVACTRAKRGLYLTMPSYMSSWDSFFTLPSRFLAEIEKTNYEVLK